MEPAKDHNLGQRQTGRSTIGQRQPYPDNSDAGTGTYSYFESGAEHQQQAQQVHQQQQQAQQQQAHSHSIQTIPEGSPVLRQSVSMPSNKSPSPPYSLSTTTSTTGTTTTTSTTPTSIEHASSSLSDNREQGSLKAQQDFRENFVSSSTHAHAHTSTGPEVQQQQQHWASVDTRFSSHQADVAYAHGHGPPIMHQPQQQQHIMQEQHQHQDQHQQQLQLQPPPHQQQPQARYNPANYPIALKLLVSNNVAGSIIGRAGQTISELQSQSTTRIKLSQTGDYFPGTQDRVCLVQGESENIKAALRLLLERFHMLQEHQHSQHMAWQLQKQKGAAAPAFDFVVRVLVPSSSCGMIIGKSGSNIKFLEDSTGVSSVRLSPKETTEGGYTSAFIMQATSERVVTVTGPTLESCLQCLFLILDGMATHPDICRYANMTTSYSRIMPDAYQVQVQAAATRPVLVPVPPPASSPRHTPEQQLWEGIHGSSYDPANLPRRTSSSPDLPGDILNQRLSVPGFATEPQTPERHTGYSPVFGGATAGYSPLQVPAMPTGGGQPLYLFPQGPHSMELTGHGHSDAVSHSVSAPDLLAIQLEQSMHLSPNLNPPPSSSPGTLDFNGLVPQVPTLTSPGCFSTQVLVPDNMIGSILGRAGHTLTELQVLSGTRIRISQRGEYMPGTRSRVVTIRGPTAQTVWQAQYMMGQRIVLPPTATYSQQQVHPSQQPPAVATMAPSDASGPHGPAPAPHGGHPGAAS